MTSAAPSIASTASVPEVARGILESLSDEWLVLALPGTSYRLHLRPTVPAAAIATPVGKRIKGVIHAKALRMFKAAGGGGGQFIEPLDGEPRIVAGRVSHIDQASRRVLVQMAAPVWVTLEDAQKPDAGGFAEGDMVNCYVESGMRFTPQV